MGTSKTKIEDPLIFLKESYALSTTVLTWREIAKRVRAKIPRIQLSRQFPPVSNPKSFSRGAWKPKRLAQTFHCVQHYLPVQNVYRALNITEKEGFQDVES